MTTSAQIRQAWEDLVFENPSILAISPNYYSREITEESEAEVGAAYEASEINFFEYVVGRNAIEYPLIGGANSAKQTFVIEVRYTRFADPEGNNYNAVIDGLETLQEVVESELGDTWQGTVDFVSEPQTIEPPTKQKFNETECFRAVARFTAIKQI